MGRRSECWRSYSTSQYPAKSFHINVYLFEKAAKAYVVVGWFVDGISKIDEW